MPTRTSITSRHNSHIKDAARLRAGRERQRRGRFIIDGAREVTRALKSGIKPCEAYIRDGFVGSTEFQEAVLAIESSAAALFQVRPDVFEKIAFGQRQQGIVVVAETPRRGVRDLEIPDKPLIAVIEGLEKPGNVGAIMRSADAAGVNAIIVASGRTDLYNPNTIRASLGTIFRPNVCDATTAETIEWLRDKKLPIIATRPDAEKLYTEINLAKGAAIVLGSEAEGLTDAWRTTGVTPVRLPMHGIADSLNVSTTAAVLFYEALRQRG
ncbi:MAG TPA: TrmH family RNA methyltransferase [Lacipirellulaceae bacterium]|nr:TrmH family RNA methyltransferase [Lacipirellulaceae bacterium]